MYAIYLSEYLFIAFSFIVHFFSFFLFLFFFFSLYIHVISFRHGSDGKHAAEVATTTLFREFKNNQKTFSLASSSVKSQESVVKESFNAAHESVLNLVQPRADMDVSLYDFGTTATVLVVNAHGEAIISWVGDTRACVFSRQPDGTYKPNLTTHDHTPELEREQRRIRGFGGKLVQTKRGLRVARGAPSVWPLFNVTTLDPEEFLRTRDEVARVSSPLKDVPEKRAAGKMSRELMLLQKDATSTIRRLERLDKKQRVSSLSVPASRSLSVTPSLLFTCCFHRKINSAVWSSLIAPFLTHFIGVQFQQSSMTLGMTRALGHWEMQQAGVAHIPDTVASSIEDGDVVVLASDGMTVNNRLSYILIFLFFFENRIISSVIVHHHFDHCCYDTDNTFLGNDFLFVLTCFLLMLFMCDNFMFHLFFKVCGVR